MRARILVAALCSLLLALPAVAGDVLWYTGHSGHDEGHTDVVALLTAEGAVVDVSSAPTLPSLIGYRLVFIVMPGFFNSGDFFTAAEKGSLNIWLTDNRHRIVLVGDWDRFYGGQAVMNDLLAAIGNPIRFTPGAFNSGCGHCAGPMGLPDPITTGLGHVCYGLTPTWDPALGVPLAYPEDPSAPGPWIVSNGTLTPCTIGIGDQNALTDPCGYLRASAGDPDTKEFTRRLYHVDCAGRPVDVTRSTWGRVKSIYR